MEVIPENGLVLARSKTIKRLGGYICRVTKASLMSAVIPYRAQNPSAKWEGKCYVLMYLF